MNEIPRSQLARLNGYDINKHEIWRFHTPSGEDFVVQPGDSLFVTLRNGNRVGGQLKWARFDGDRLTFMTEVGIVEVALPTITEAEIGRPGITWQGGALIALVVLLPIVLILAVVLSSPLPH